MSSREDLDRDPSCAQAAPDLDARRPDTRRRTSSGRRQYDRARQGAEQTAWESERKLAALMDNLPGMAYRCGGGPDWIAEFVSAGVVALTGYRADELIGPEARITPAAMIHPEDLAPVRGEIQRAIAESRQFKLEYRLITAAGAEKWVWERGNAVRGPAGDVLGIEGFITDITARRQAEDVQRQRAVELETFHRMSVGRELRMIELKEEVNALAEQAGRPAPYDLSFLET